MSDRFQRQADGSGGGGSGITDLQGDVTATGPGVATATVVGLQNNPVDNAAPNLGDVLTWDGAKWTPAASSGGGGPQTAFDVDFTLEPTVDLKAGGDQVYTFGGVDFTAVGTGNASLWEVNPLAAPATGMNIKSSGNGGWSTLLKTMASMSLDPRTVDLYLVMRVIITFQHQNDDNLVLLTTGEPWAGVVVPPTSWNYTNHYVSFATGARRNGGQQGFGADASGVAQGTWTDQLVLLSQTQGSHVVRVESLPWYGQWPDTSSVDALLASFPQDVSGTPPSPQSVVTLLSNAKANVNTPQDGVWAITNACGNVFSNLFQIPRVALYYV